MLVSTFKYVPSLLYNFFLFLGGSHWSHTLQYAGYIPGSVLRVTASDAKETGCDPGDGTTPSQPKNMLYLQYYLLSLIKLLED